MIPSKDEWLSTLNARHGDFLQDRFLSSTIAICGLGGLGSNIAISLARAGIGKLILIDFDIVDISNLHRQQYKACQIGEYKTDALRSNLLEIAPYCECYTFTDRLDERNCLGYLKDADIVCEAFDDPVAKAMLIDCVLEKMPNKFIVAASGLAGISSSNLISTKKITSRFYLCGDGVSKVDASNPLISSRVMLCAAHQAHMVLRLIAGEFES